MTYRDLFRHLALAIACLLVAASSYQATVGQEAQPPADQPQSEADAEAPAAPAEEQKEEQSAEPAAEADKQQAAADAPKPPKEQATESDSQPATEEPQSEDSQPEESEPKQPQSEEPKAEEPQPEEPKPEEPAPDDAKPEEPKSADTKPEEAKSEEPKPAEPNSEEKKSEESKPNEKKSDKKTSKDKNADNKKKSQDKKPQDKKSENNKPQEKPQPKPKPQPKKLTATSLDQVDADFAYQGEYASASRSGFGLQVIALGGEKFDAVLYPGGLPGAGWAGGTKYSMSGERENDLIHFTGAPYSVKVRGEYAELLSHGSHAGFLRKQHRVSPTMHAAAPRGAKILFDGSSTEAFVKGKLTPEGWLAAGTSTVDKVRDFRLHLEFKLPYKPDARGQGRGNSGVYIQRRYEVQVLDSFGLEGEPNECGGLYRQQAPNVNMCLPPLSWQTYDITFRAARFDDEGNKIENARITVLHNGYPIHSNYELTGKTGAGRKETDEPGEIYLQDHGNPVVFRNIWLVEGDQLTCSTRSNCRSRCRTKLFRHHRRCR